jgi:hypothetical protein
MESTKYKRKEQAKKFRATNYTERTWEEQLEISGLSPGVEKDGEDL